MNKKFLYLNELSKAIGNLNLSEIDDLCRAVLSTHKKKGKIFICGNGGSAANANHISNDLMLGMNKKKLGFRFISLNANVPQLTCIANDLDYSQIFSHQLKILGNKGDLLIALSGSGNSKNIIKAISQANKQKIFSYGLLGYNGGKSKKICKKFIHFKSYDMQICEDLQMIVMNQVMKNLTKFF